MEKVFSTRRRPAVIRSDNGWGFIAATVVTWPAKHEITAAFMAKGRPQQKCYVERFNGTMRNGLLDGELFTTLPQARVVVTRWAEGYKHPHRHSSLGMMTPASEQWNTLRASGAGQPRSNSGGNIAENMYPHGNRDEILTEMQRRQAMQTLMSGV